MRGRDAGKGIGSGKDAWGEGGYPPADRPTTTLPPKKRDPPVQGGRRRGGEAMAVALGGTLRWAGAALTLPPLIIARKLDFVKGVLRLRGRQAGNRERNGEEAEKDAGEGGYPPADRPPAPRPSSGTGSGAARRGTLGSNLLPQELQECAGTFRSHTAPLPAQSPRAMARGLACLPLEKRQQGLAHLLWKKLRENRKVQVLRRLVKG